MTKNFFMSRLPTALTVAAVALAGAGTAFLTLRAGAAPPPADAPLVIYGEDGLTPIYVEDPLDGFGVPIPIGPQHEIVCVRDRGTIGPNPPQPAPVFQSPVLYDAYGNALPADPF